jgi:hypothetical protein
MIADWAENYVELLMLEFYLNSNPIPEMLVSLWSGIKSFKWSLSVLTYLLILLGIVMALIRLLRKSKRYKKLGLPNG